MSPINIWIHFARALTYRNTRTSFRLIKCPRSRSPFGRPVYQGKPSHLYSPHPGLVLPWCCRLYPAHRWYSRYGCCHSDRVDPAWSASCLCSAPGQGSAAYCQPAADQAPVREPVCLLTLDHFLIRCLLLRGELLYCIGFTRHSRCQYHCAVCIRDIAHRRFRHADAQQRPSLFSTTKLRHEAIL